MNKSVQLKTVPTADYSTGKGTFLFFPGAASPDCLAGSTRGRGIKKTNPKYNLFVIIAIKYLFFTLLSHTMHF